MPHGSSSKTPMHYYLVRYSFNGKFVWAGLSSFWKCHIFEFARLGKSLNTYQFCLIRYDCQCRVDLT